VLGGGGYALPRYLERFWPNGAVDVAEIDPGVTKAAFAAFELDPGTKINTINLDARNYIDSICEERRLGGQPKKYDFIYEDAINDYSVPHQLTTKEFNDKLYGLLADDGIYMVDLIDTFDSALFLGAVINTLEQTFPFVTVIAQNNINACNRNTFVVVAAKRKLDLTDVCRDCKDERIIWYLSESEIGHLRRKSNAMVLTDDYAPVENLLAPVVLRNINAKSELFADLAIKYAQQGNSRKVIQNLNTLIGADPAKAIKSYFSAARILSDTGKTYEALAVYENALDLFTDPQYKVPMMILRHNYAMLLKKAGAYQQAAEQLDIVSNVCRQELDENADALEPRVMLANTLAEKGDFAAAAEHFQKVVELQPDNPENRIKLIMALQAAGKTDSVAQAAQNATEYFQGRNRTEDAAAILKYINQIQSQKPSQ
jgi:Tfp pilus assembly protein PilF